MKRTPCVTGEYYHIYNRGIEKRDVFSDTRDYKRFLCYLQLFNSDFKSFPGIDAFQGEEASDTSVNLLKLVDVVCYCLMPNHFHLLLKQRENMGIALFMQKLGTGYTMYFNKKYERSGVLFQGAFKSKIIENDSYLMHLSRYIHLNPRDLYCYAEGEKDGPRKLKHFIKTYPWSSFRQCLDPEENQFLSPEILLGYFSKNGYEKFVFSEMNKADSSLAPLMFD
ncbi:MAG: transposase [Candidatus Omnitrophota bacterium]